MRDHRAYVGPPEFWDPVGVQQFFVLLDCGLAMTDHLLDVGCGSLRAGRFLIPYLDRRRYYGVEPNRWLLKAAIGKEISKAIVAQRNPQFYHFDDLGLSSIGRSFDYILAHSILTHASLAQTEKIFLESSKCLAPDGALVATYFKGDDNMAEEWTYPGGVTYRPDTINAVAAKRGLTVRELDYRHPAGQTWIVARSEET